MKLLTIFLLSLIASVTLSQVITRGGRYTASYVATDPFRANRGEVRTKTVQINFAAAYATMPKVAVWLYSFSTNYRSAGVSVEVDEIELDHFTFTITAPLDAIVNSVGVSWIASNSIRVNMEYFNAEDPEASNVGEYTIGASLEFPAQSSSYSVDALPFIAGFQFPENSDPQIHAEVNSLSNDGVGLDIWVQGDNIPNYVSILVLHFRSDFGKSFSFASAANGALYNGSGERHQYINRYVAQKNYFIVNGISGFHFVGSKGYRVRHLATQTNTDTQTRIRYDMSTWETSQIYQTHGNLLYI